MACVRANRWLVAGLVMLWATALSVGSVVSAEKEKSDKSDKKAGVTADAKKSRKDEGEKKPGGRLPPHFGDVVNAQQREKIYQIQGEYAAKLAAARKQLADVQKELNDKIDALLTPEQRKKIDQLKEAAAAKRGDAKAESKKAEK